MYPYIHLGPLTITSYVLCGALAYLIAKRVFEADLTRHGHPKERSNLVFVVVALVGVLGAKVYDALQDPIALLADPARRIFSSPGLTWMGAFLAGTAMLWVMAKKIKMPAVMMFDLASPTAALAYAIGRLGCFFSGDGCYGLPTSLPWGMSFPNGVVPTFQHVHPTPLYEFIVNLGISCYLWRFASKPRQIGVVVSRYLILSGAARFAVEFLRRNPRLYLGMSNAQVVSVLCMIAGIVLLARSKGERRKEPTLAVATA